MKRKKITNTQQEVAVDILMQLTFCKTMEEVHQVYRDVYEWYELCDDPFTKLPCTRKEYLENGEEYDKQRMIERYGYYE